MLVSPAKSSMSCLCKQTCRVPYSIELYGSNFLRIDQLRSGRSIITTAPALARDVSLTYLSLFSCAHDDCSIDSRTESCIAITVLFNMDLSRQEYPLLLVRVYGVRPTMCACAEFSQNSLQPGQAVTVLNDRVRLIGKINLDIADWLQVLVLRPIIGKDAHSWVGATASRGSLRAGAEEACKQETTRCRIRAWVVCNVAIVLRSVNSSQYISDAMADHRQLHGITRCIPYYACSKDRGRCRAAS